jgi:hypothetical protein
VPARTNRNGCASMPRHSRAIPSRR